MTDPSTAVSTSEPILPLTVVIVGVTGDLTRRLLFPALHRLVAMAQLDAAIRVVGYAIDDWTTAQMVTHLHDAVGEFGDGVDEAVWPTLAASMTYVKGDLSTQNIEALCALVTGRAIFYLALPPTLFAQAATALGAAGLANQDGGWRRLVIEKPFGTSLDTALTLQAELSVHWSEDQLFRIDHFLGKDTVQNLLVFRLANRFIEAIWNVTNIAQVQITAAETIGLEGRWRYYDTAGALRDMIQNHLMQLFALCAMEPLSVWDSEVLREHKVEALRSVRPFTATDLATRSVRGQYGAGENQIAYRAEEHIDAASNTETYAAVQLFVDNWRWLGVPFSLRSGKRMSGDVTEIALELRDPPSTMFGAGHGSGKPGGGNWIVLRLRPDETIEIDAVAKRAGLGLTTERLVLAATDPSAGGSEYSAYEQLLLDIVAGDRSLFIRNDEALQAWKIMQPVLDAWASSGEPEIYPSGSDGPPAPAGFFDHGRNWRTITTQELS